MNWAVDFSKMYAPTEGQANLFGVIIYTDAHAYVKKVLRDNDYWQALDEISGPRWAVFAVRAVQGEYGFPNLGPGQIGMMRMVWKEPRANKELLNTFEIASTEDLPAIAIFAQDQDGEVYKTILKIDDSSEDNAFKTIKEILHTVANALEKVGEENLQEGVRAYHAVGYSIRNYEEWKILKRGFHIVERIKSWK
jgi:hypothetical protein